MSHSHILLFEMLFLMALNVKLWPKKKLFKIEKLHTGEGVGGQKSDKIVSRII
jgi:hypothetical protein